MSQGDWDEAVRSRPELLGMLPYALGHHPDQSLVAVFLDADRIVQVVGRLDLAAPPALAVSQWADVAVRQATASVVLVGYGSSHDGGRVSAVADALGAHVPVGDVLLVADGRFFCLWCPCPAAAGVPFDPAATAAAARATLAGKVTLGSRAELVALADPDPVEQATVGAVLAGLPVEVDEPVAVLRYLMEAAADGQRLTPAEVARLVRCLSGRAVRDAALRATGTAMWQRDLWLDVTRRAPHGFVAGPACLAAWCAWQRGEHTLASAALRRALSADPDYLLARLIVRSMQAGIPAAILRAAIPAVRTHPSGDRS